MKDRLFILICFIFLLSCAEEGPYVGGDLDCLIEVTGVSANSAYVSVTFPNTKDNLLLPPNWGDKLYVYPELKSEDQIVATKISENSGVTYYKFYGLTPNTTYYLMVSCRARLGIKKGLDGDNRGYAVVSSYVPGYSFTTTKEGGEYGATYELLDYHGKVWNSYYTVVKVKFPSRISIDSYINSKLKAISLSGNGKTIESIYLSSNINSYYPMDSGEYIFFFPVLEKEKYKLQLNCDLKIFDMTYRSDIISFNETLDLTNVSDK